MKRKSNAPIVICFVFAVIFFCVGILFIVGSFGMSKELVPVSTVTASSLSDRVSYQIDDLIAVDSYAKKTGGSTSGDYYLVAFFDKDDTLCLASFYPNKDDVLEGKLSDYADDEDQQIFDCYFPACVRVSRMSRLDSSLDEFYQDAVDSYSDILKDFQPVDTGLHFTFEGADADDYEKSLANDRLILRIAGGLIAALGVALLISGICTRNKRKPHKVAYVPFDDLGNPVNPYEPGDTSNDWPANRGPEDF